ncbi:MAG: phosphatase PAP2 family protein [Hyphomicrobiaceae bacterium]
MNQKAEPHLDHVDDATLPGADFARKSLVTATLVSSGLLATWAVTSLFAGDGLAGLDLAATQWLRAEGSPTDPLGPDWLDGAMRDVTALGSNLILFLVVGVVLAFLALTGRQGPALLLGWTTVASFLLNNLLKFAIGRARPDFLTPAVIADSSSFPSGHAMHTATVFLLIAALAAREMIDRRLRALVMGTAVALTAAVGLTRIHLGAHWTSDVLTGWTIGTALALVGWLLARSPRPPS